MEEKGPSMDGKKGVSVEGVSVEGASVEGASVEGASVEGASVEKKGWRYEDARMIKI
jgi:hypothetical protein